MGIPPETVKDSLRLGIKIPSYYVIPSKRFDKELGIATVELEFPTLFNLFINKEKITFICTKDDSTAIRDFF